MPCNKWAIDSKKDFWTWILEKESNSHFLLNHTWLLLVQSNTLIHSRYIIISIISTLLKLKMRLKFRMTHNNNQENNELNIECCQSPERMKCRAGFRLTTLNLLSLIGTGWTIMALKANTMLERDRRCRSVSCMVEQFRKSGFPWNGTCTGVLCFEKEWFDLIWN